MDTYLAHEIEEFLSVMRRQNREISKLIFYECDLQVIKCTEKSKPPNFCL